MHDWWRNGLINIQSVVFIVRLIDWIECDIVVTEHRQWCHVQVELYSWKAELGAGLDFFVCFFFADVVIQRSVKSKERKRTMNVSQPRQPLRPLCANPYMLIVLTLPFLIFFPTLTGENFVNPLSFVRRQSLQQRRQLKLLQLRALTASPAGAGFL